METTEATESLKGDLPLRRGKTESFRLRLDVGIALGNATKIPVLVFLDFPSSLFPPVLAEFFSTSNLST